MIYSYNGKVQVGPKSIFILIYKCLLLLVCSVNQSLSLPGYGGKSGRNVVGMPHCLNAPISKSQCPNREVAMPHFWTECPTFLVVVYICIYIILKIIVRLLNTFHLHLFLAAIYIYYMYIYIYIYVYITYFI